MTLGDIAQLASAGGLGAMAWFFVWKLHPELVRIREVNAAVLEYLRKTGIRLEDRDAAPSEVRDVPTAPLGKVKLG